MKKIIAVCLDYDESLNNNNLFANLEKGGFYYYLSQILKDKYTFMTGDVAYNDVISKNIEAQNIIIIAELDSEYAEKLINLGAVPKVIQCGECMIYAKSFYKKLSWLPAMYQNRVLFSGSFTKTKNCDANHNINMYFPSYNDDDVQDIKSWKARKFLCQVMANKYVEQGNYYPAKFNIKKNLKWFFRKYIYETSDEKFMRTHELQSTRLKVIEYFGSRDMLDLYGGHWNSLKNLPKVWKKRLGSIIAKMNPQRIDDKFSVISNYKFNLAIENLEYEGYVTEKIIHAFVGGTIPVYLGAKNISDFIPNNCFIDMRNFSTYDDLNNYMQNMSEEEAFKYLNNGRAFLKSDAAKLYNNKSYAEFIAKLIEVNV